MKPNVEFRVEITPLVISNKEGPNQTLLFFFFFFFRKGPEDKKGQEPLV